MVIVCGSQMGKTETLFNILGHRFTDGPYVPALYLAPTEKNARSMSKDRVHKMLQSSEVLWERVEKGHRYTTYEKWIGGTPLRFGWAGSATEVASHPCGIVVIDERDRMSSDTGNEGDPVELGRARLTNYQNHKLIVSSTPTIENASPVWSLLEEGTMHFWSWKCLHCPTWFVPRIDLLKWPDGCTADEALENAGVVCPGCGVLHGNGDQHRLNEAGRFIRHRKLGEKEESKDALWATYVPDANAKSMRTASFWVSGLASPWRSFGKLARLLIQAYKSGESERIQGVINTGGGELWRVKGDAPEWEEVRDCKLEYPQRSVPWGVQRITMGADVQKAGIFWVIRGWGHNSESWLLDHGYLPGETEYEEVWHRFRDILHAPIGDRRVDRAFIDSGYRPGDKFRRPDHAVYTFSRSQQGLVYPTKGQATMDKPFSFVNLDYTYGGVVVKSGIRLFHLNTDFLKRWIHGRIRWPADQSGGWHIHSAWSEDYCKQIVSEHLVHKTSGKSVWMIKLRNNHYLDAEVNATAAALSLNVHQLPPLPPLGASPATSPTSEAPAAQSRYKRADLL